VTFDVTDDLTTYVLGCNWILNTDKVSYNVHLTTLQQTSYSLEIAHIYYPIRLFSLVTTELRRLIKYFWYIEFGWDDKILQEAADP